MPLYRNTAISGGGGGPSEGGGSYEGDGSPRLAFIGITLRGAQSVLSLNTAT